MPRTGLGVEDHPPPVMKFVPKLKGIANWPTWNGNLLSVLEAVDSKLSRRLTGEYEKLGPIITTPANATEPAVLAQPDPTAVMAWHECSQKLISCLYATTMPELHEGHIHAAADAFSAYQSLQNRFGSSTRSILFKFSQFSSLPYFLGLRYFGEDPQDFVDRWCAALEKAQEASGPFFRRHVYYLSLVAI